jgi:hypothetical protein
MARISVQRGGVSVRLDTDAWERALGRFLRRAEARVEEVGAELGERVSADVASRLEGVGGQPRRVDTGALQRAWRDAPIRVRQRGVRWRASWRNREAHAAAVEYGTSEMAPGLHLTSALAEARAPGRRALADTVRQTWRGR